MLYEMLRRLLVIVFVLFLGNIRFVFLFEEEGKCVPLGVTKCQELNYTMTLMPNVKMNLDTMDEVGIRVNEFSPLFKVNCYENFKFFICNMYIPVCQPINNDPIAVYPCRHVCEAARKGCEPVMRRYKFLWPEHLRCDTLLSIEDDPNALCGRPPPPKPSTTAASTLYPPTITPKETPEWMTIISKFPKNIDWKEYFSQDHIWKVLSRAYDINQDVSKICALNSDLVHVKRNKQDYCPQRCDADTVFTKNNKNFATLWISIWSVICFLSTLLTVATFLIDHKRFKYPERPIIFLSFCYNLYSIGYLIRVFGGYERVICESSESNAKHLVIEGMDVTSCTLVFFLLYFFGMASALWWVILSLTWFLSAALKWGHEAIEKYSPLFHFVSWVIPTVQTVIALTMHKVDADKLSGLCFIGNERSEDLLFFVALPLMIYLLVGTLFLIMGFIALIKIRKVLRKQRNTNKFERLVVRIGIFSVLYSVPAMIVVGCFIQEYNRLKLAEKEVVDIVRCLSNDKTCTDSLKPRVELFYLRYFMLLVVGVTSGVWIWTSKTLVSWKRFYTRSDSAKDKRPQERFYYKSNFHNQHSNRQIGTRCDSTNVSGHINMGPPGMIAGTSSMPSIQMQHPLYPSPARYYFPVVKNPADNIMHARNIPLIQQQKGPVVSLVPIVSNHDNNTTDDNDHVFGPPSTQNELTTSVQSSKPYSDTSERNSLSYNSLVTTRTPHHENGFCGDGESNKVNSHIIK